MFHIIAAMAAQMTAAGSYASYAAGLSDGSGRVAPIQTTEKPKEEAKVEPPSKKRYDWEIPKFDWNKE